MHQTGNCFYREVSDGVGESEDRNYGPRLVFTACIWWTLKRYNTPLPTALENLGPFNSPNPELKKN